MTAMVVAHKRRVPDRKLGLDNEFLLYFSGSSARTAYWSRSLIEISVDLLTGPEVYFAIEKVHMNFLIEEISPFGY
jgi:hypothetical protein